MKKIEKLILSGVIIGFGTIFNLFFTAALHGLLSRQYDRLTLIPLFQCISGLFTQQRQLLMFLSFEGFIWLCCVLFWVQNDRPYQSDFNQGGRGHLHPGSRWAVPARFLTLAAGG